MQNMSYAYYYSPEDDVIKPKGRTSDTMDGDEVVQVYLASPFTAMIVGPTGSGKTTLLFDLIAQARSISEPSPSKIIYCYGIWQKAYEEIEHLVEFHDGLLADSDLPDGSQGNTWLILDDLMTEISGSASTKKLYTMLSHHQNISVFFVLQNMFPKGNETVSRNSGYFFVMSNPRDGLQFKTFAQQLPHNTEDVMVSYEHATRAPYSYLFLDLKQGVYEKVRFVADAFHSTKYMRVRLPPT